MYSIKVRENILIAHSLPGEVFGPAQNMYGATYLVDAEFFTDNLNKYNYGFRNSVHDFKRYS